VVKKLAALDQLCRRRTGAPISLPHTPNLVNGRPPYTKASVVAAAQYRRWPRWEGCWPRTDWRPV